MKKLLLAGAALALGVALSGCASLGVPGAGNSGLTDAALKIAQDPNCGHSDTVDVILGPVPSGHVHFERSCPKGETAAPVAPASQAAPAQ
jgi:hypothetical protein